MRKVIFILILIFTSIQCKKETLYCWQCLDAASNEWLNECNMTENEAKSKFIGRTMYGHTATEADFRNWCHKY